MTGTAILKFLLANYPNAAVRAALHKREPFVKHAQVEYTRGDLSSLDDCRRMVHGCDYAIMAAAHAGGVNFTSVFPWKHMDDNLMMNKQMLEAFYLEGVRRVVFIGSAAIYQEFEGSIKEGDLDLNKDPHEAYFGYGWGMRFLEKLCAFLNRKYGMEIIMVRAANIFGPYDKFDPKTSNFIPATIRKAVDRMDPFEVWGTPDVTRDVIYVDDFARAVVMMLADGKIKFDTFNVGSGMKTTVGDVVDWALKYSGHSPSKVKYVSENRPVTIKFRALDCCKAKRVVGWEPLYTIEEGLRLTTEWWVKNKESWDR